ncbi:MAG TPA: hypothetical protein VGD50_00855 [Candidatus Baltobacteraceae bacterium]
MKKVSSKGVVLGAITDIVATNLLTIPIMIYAVTKIDIAHTPKDQLAAQLTATIHGDPFIYGVSLFAGVACSILGGYVAAWLAKHDELLNRALSSFLCVSFGVMGMASHQQSAPPWQALLLEIAAPVAGLAGGYLRLLQKKRIPPSVSLPAM